MLKVRCSAGNRAAGGLSKLLQISTHKIVKKKTNCFCITQRQHKFAVILTLTCTWQVTNYNIRTVLLLLAESAGYIVHAAHPKAGGAKIL